MKILRGGGIPVWLMRQAGRYLPEYKAIRETSKNFLELCYDVEKATEITLQPIKRYKFDAAIIFSDILVLPHSLGWNLHFEEGIGPILQQFTSESDFRFLQNNQDDKLSTVYEIIRNVRGQLPETTSLIGFAGAPWTVMSYLLEGRGKQDFRISKRFIYENRTLSEELINFITEKTTIHLINQIKAGADTLKIFDSWAGILAGEEYEKFVIEPTRKIVVKIKKHFPDIPIIGFPRNSGLLYERYIEQTKVDIIALDQYVPIKAMKHWSKYVVVQGNLDPVVLLSSKEVIKEKLDKLLYNFDQGNFIFNLGHGILPETKVENVEFLVNYIKKNHIKENRDR